MGMQRAKFGGGGRPGESPALMETKGKPLPSRKFMPGKMMVRCPVGIAALCRYVLR